MLHCSTSTEDLLNGTLCVVFFACPFHTVSMYVPLCGTGTVPVSSKKSLFPLPPSMLGSGVPILELLSFPLPLFINAKLIILLENSAWLPSGAWFKGVGSA